MSPSREQSKTGSAKNSALGPFRNRDEVKKKSAVSHFNVRKRRPATKSDAGDIWRRLSEAGSVCGLADRAARREKFWRSFESTTVVEKSEIFKNEKRLWKMLHGRRQCSTPALTPPPCTPRGGWGEMK